MSPYTLPNTADPLDLTGILDQHGQMSVQPLGPSRLNVTPWLQGYLESCLIMKPGTTPELTALGFLGVIDVRYDEAGKPNVEAAYFVDPEASEVAPIANALRRATPEVEPESVFSSERAIYTLDMRVDMETSDQGIIPVGYGCFLVQYVGE